MNLLNSFKVEPMVHTLSSTTIQFRQGRDKIIKLALKDDVTPKESTLISVMFCVAVGSASTMALWDYLGYIKENNLERHFEVTTV